jgi:hypothetical protein
LVLSQNCLADGGISVEAGYLFNTLLLLVCGVLVMFMAAGFAMLEAGMVRSKSVAVILAKNVALYALATVVFLLIGYELMYGASDSLLVGRLAICRRPRPPAPMQRSANHRPPPGSSRWFSSQPPRRWYPAHWPSVSGSGRSPSSRSR